MTKRPHRPSSPLCPDVSLEVKDVEEGIEKDLHLLSYLYFRHLTMTLNEGSQVTTIACSVDF